MADLQIAGRREQPLQRDLLVAQRRQVGRERRLVRRERLGDLVPALGADRVDVPRVDRARV